MLSLKSQYRMLKFLYISLCVLAFLEEYSRIIAVLAAPEAPRAVFTACAGKEVAGPARASRGP